MPMYPLGTLPMLSFSSITKFSVTLVVYIRPRIFSLFLRLLEFYAFNEPSKHFFSALVMIRRNYSLNFHVWRNIKVRL
jgi:hypothetical protein